MMVSNIRIGGLASGMDIDQLVSDLMRAERMKGDRLYQQKQLLEWKRDDYREINSKLFDLKNYIFNQFELETNFHKKTTTSSNENIVTATASSSANTTTYTLSNITLATAATNVSSNPISKNSNDKVDPNQSLWSMKDKFDQSITWQQNTKNDSISVSSDGKNFKLTYGAITNGTVSITVNGSPYTVVTDKNSLDAPGEVYVDLNTGAIEFYDTISAGSTIEASYEYNYFNFSLSTYDENGQLQTENFTINGTQSLNQVLSTISKSSILGVSAFYDEVQDKVVLTRKQTGDFNASGVEMNVDGDSFLNTVLKLSEANEQGGTDAQFDINGLTTTRHSNTFTIDNVTFTLKANTAPGEKVTINVQNDIDAIYNNIVGFVEKYNEVIDHINSKLLETRYRDYLPLTDEQKEEMTEKQIELWEEKARSGLLRGDFVLSNALSKMRLALYDKVANSEIDPAVDYDDLVEIGISTSSLYQDRGKLIIDESKLRDAIEKNPDAVYKLFIHESDNYSEQGLLTRLQDILDDTIKSITEKAGQEYYTDSQYALGKELIDLNNRIDAFERRLTEIEDRYWRQFTAMEQAIQRANEQAMMLMGQFGGKFF
jgi:flagellar hook-associated protein 2